MKNNNMKKKNFLSRVLNPGMAHMCAALLMMAGCLTACSSDDDGDDDGGGGSSVGQFDTPAYKDVSAKYVISSAESDIASIELTESGTYVIVEKGYGPSYIARKSAPAKRFGRVAAWQASASANGIIGGKFVKVSDTEYILEGFGSIVITGSADNAFEIQVTEQGGEPYTLKGNKATPIADTEYTQALCRTWKLDKFTLKFIYNGKVLFSETLPASQYRQMWVKLNNYMNSHYGDDGEGWFDVPEYTPNGVIFSRAGSYLVKYDGDELQLSVWQWEADKKGIIRYSHDYSDMHNPDYSNTCTISYDGTAMFIDEVNMEESEDGETVKLTSRWQCSEEK